MSDNPIARLSAAEGKRLGLPEDFKIWTAFPFGGINQEDARTAIMDSEFYWLENFILTGKGSLRALWDVGPALYTAPGTLTIVYFNWFNIGSGNNCAVFLSDGTAVQVAYPSGTVTTISSTTGTFYTGGQLPVACQSGETFLLIGNNLTANSYWIWDGVTLYSAGSLGPYVIGDITDGGSGYTSVPTVTLFGGSGTGAVITPTVVNGSIVALTITNPGTGYSPGDDVQIAFSGGGSDVSAILTASLVAGTVDTLEILAGGTGYTSAPAVSFTGGGGGSGATATATVTAGVVTALAVTANGSGYTSTPVVVFTGGAGTGAVAIAVLSQGAVSSINVVSGGDGFTGTPLLTITGGGGTGAAGTAVMNAGSIASVTLTNAGSGYTAPPTVTVEAGLNNAAAAANAIMPFGVSGTTIETFLSRVWIGNPAQIGPDPVGGTFQVSAPSSVVDFSPADGGLLFSSTDRFLRDRYVCLHQSNGYLYPIGDSSVSVVTNVQTAGSPLVTTFNYLNSSAQIGAAWRDSVCDFGQTIAFANGNGIQGLYGGAVRRVSQKLNPVFNNAVLPPTANAVYPSAAVANIYGIRVYFLLLTITDPFTANPRTVMIAWDEKNWFVASQSTALTFIAGQEINSQMTAWGTNGSALMPLFSTPSAALTGTIATKAFAGERAYVIKEPLAFYVRATDVSTGQAGIVLNVTMGASGIAQQAGQRPQLPAATWPLEVQPNFVAPVNTQPVWAGATSAVPGTELHLTITSTSVDFVVSDVAVAYRECAPLFG